MVSNWYNPETDKLNLVSYERVQTMIGLLKRTEQAAPGLSKEIYREGQHLCSLRMDETGIDSTVKPGIPTAILNHGDDIFSVYLGERIRVLSGPLRTKDDYRPGYQIELRLRINDPLRFLHYYFQQLDPVGRLIKSIEGSLKAYARATLHDQISEKRLINIVRYRRESQEVGIEVVYVQYPEIFWDQSRQQIRTIEKQTEIAKAIERKNAAVVRTKSEAELQEEARRREYSRREKARDNDFELREQAKKQSYQNSQKIREQLMEIVGAKGAEAIIRELDTVETFSELFNKYPQLLQAYPTLSQFQSYPALSQFQALSSQPLVLESPKPKSANPQGSNQPQQNTGHHRTRSRR